MIGTLNRRQFLISNLMAWVKVLNLHMVLNEASPLKRPIPNGAGQVENLSARAKEKSKKRDRSAHLQNSCGIVGRAKVL